MLASVCLTKVSSRVVHLVSGHAADRYTNGPHQDGPKVLQVKTHYETLLPNNAERKRLARFPDGFSVPFHECGGFQTW